MPVGPDCLVRCLFRFFLLASDSNALLEGLAGSLNLQSNQWKYQFVKNLFDQIRVCFCFILRFLVSEQCFLSFSTQSHAQSFRNFFKNSVLDPTSVKSDQKSKFGHVRTCPASPGGQVLVSKAAFLFFLQKVYLSNVH